MLKRLQTDRDQRQPIQDAAELVRRNRGREAEVLLVGHGVAPDKVAHILAAPERAAAAAAAQRASAAAAAADAAAAAAAAAAHDPNAGDNAITPENWLRRALRAGGSHTIVAVPPRGSAQRVFLESSLIHNRSFFVESFVDFHNAHVTGKDEPIEVDALYDSMEIPGAPSRLHVSDVRLPGASVSVTGEYFYLLALRDINCGDVTDPSILERGSIIQAADNRMNRFVDLYTNTLVRFDLFSSPNVVPINSPVEQRVIDAYVAHAQNHTMDVDRRRLQNLVAFFGVGLQFVSDYRGTLNHLREMRQERLRSEAEAEARRQEAAREAAARREEAAREAKKREAADYLANEVKRKIEEELENRRAAAAAEQRERWQAAEVGEEGRARGLRLVVKCASSAHVHVIRKDGSGQLAYKPPRKEPDHLDEVCIVFDINNLKDGVGHNGWIVLTGSRCREAVKEANDAALAREGGIYGPDFINHVAHSALPEIRLPVFKLPEDGAAPDNVATLEFRKDYDWVHVLTFQTVEISEAKGRVSIAKNRVRRHLLLNVGSETGSTRLVVVESSANNDHATQAICQRLNRVSSVAASLVSENVVKRFHTALVPLAGRNLRLAIVPNFLFLRDRGGKGGEQWVKRFVALGARPTIVRPGFGFIQARLDAEMGDINDGGPQVSATELLHRVWSVSRSILCDSDLSDAVRWDQRLLHMLSIRILTLVMLNPPPIALTWLEAYSPRAVEDAVHAVDERLGLVANPHGGPGGDADGEHEDGVVADGAGAADADAARGDLARAGPAHADAAHANAAMAGAADAARGDLARANALPAVALPAEADRARADALPADALPADPPRGDAAPADAARGGGADAGAAVHPPSAEDLSAIIRPFFDGASRDGSRLRDPELDQIGFVAGLERFTQAVAAPATFFDENGTYSATSRDVDYVSMGVEVLFSEERSRPFLARADLASHMAELGLLNKEFSYPGSITCQVNASSGPTKWTWSDDAQAAGLKPGNVSWFHLGQNYQRAVSHAGNAYHLYVAFDTTGSLVDRAFVDLKDRVLNACLDAIADINGLAWAPNRGGYTAKGLFDAPGRAQFLLAHRVSAALPIFHMPAFCMCFTARLERDSALKGRSFAVVLETFGNKEFSGTTASGVCRGDNIDTRSPGADPTDAPVQIALNLLAPAAFAVNYEEVHDDIRELGDGHLIWPFLWSNIGFGVTYTASKLGTVLLWDVSSWNGDFVFRENMGFNFGNRVVLAADWVAAKAKMGDSPVDDGVVSVSLYNKTLQQMAGPVVLRGGPHRFKVQAGAATGAQNYAACVLPILAGACEGRPWATRAEITVCGPVSALQESRRKAANALDTLDVLVADQRVLLFGLLRALAPALLQTQGHGVLPPFMLRQLGRRLAYLFEGDVGNPRSVRSVGSYLARNIVGGELESVVSFVGPVLGARFPEAPVTRLPSTAAGGDAARGDMDEGDGAGSSSDSDGRSSAGGGTDGIAGGRRSVGDSEGGGDDGADAADPEAKADTISRVWRKLTRGIAWDFYDHVGDLEPLPTMPVMLEAVATFAVCTGKLLSACTVPELAVLARNSAAKSDQIYRMFEKVRSPEWFARRAQLSVDEANQRRRAQRELVHLFRRDERLSERYRTLLDEAVDAENEAAAAEAEAVAEASSDDEDSEDEGASSAGEEDEDSDDEGGDEESAGAPDPPPSDDSGGDSSGAESDRRRRGGRRTNVELRRAPMQGKRGQERGGRK
jgi:hypothetical protein